jgi:hypothetical protein
LKIVKRFGAEDQPTIIHRLIATALIHAGPWEVTSWLTELAAAHEADVIFIDGPQDWKDPSNGL